MEIKPLSGLTKTLSVLLKINIVITAIAVFAGIYDYKIYRNLPSDFDPNETFLPSDAFAGSVGVVQFILFIILGITFLCWIYRTNKNLHMLSGEEMRFTPGWSVGWYFIPIANLFKPYQAMKEIWRVSHKNEPTSYSLLGWWWFFWIVSNFLGTFAFKTVMKAHDLESYITSTLIYIISDGIEVILNIVALMLVTEIWQAYSRNMDEKTGALDWRFSDTPPPPIT